MAIYIYGLWGRMPDIDDAWIGIDAYTLAKDGYVHTDLMHGINQQGELFVVHHKLWNLNGALFIRIFGFSLYTLKSVSLVYFLLFLILFGFYTLKWKKLFNLEGFLFSLILILSFPWIFKFSFLYRPEIMMMTLGFAAFILLEKYTETERNKTLLVFISGIFFGLTMVAHLNGLILAAAAFLLLLYTEKKFIPLVVFSVGVLLAFTVYFYDYTDPSYFTLWQQQFFNAPYLDSLEYGPSWLKPVVNLLREHMRYFHNLQIIVFSVFLLVTLLIGLRYLFRKHGFITSFALLVALMTGILAMHKSRQYLLLNFPYLVILITLTTKALMEGKITRFKWGGQISAIRVLFSLVIIYVTVSTYFNIKLSLKKFTPETNRMMAEKYADGSEAEMKIVGPMTFIFNEVEHFKRIQGDLCYVQLQKMDSTVFGEGFLDKAETFHTDLIMVEPKYQGLLGIDHMVTGDTVGAYWVVDDTEQAKVFKRLDK
ncbi:MAG: hypothetical protein P8100_00025 [bacterium]